MDCKTAQQKIMPYIERRLSAGEMEDFIEHIQSCKACSEELEVYFTIYYALEKLERDEQGSYNIEEMLERDLERTRGMIERKNMFDFIRRFLLVVLGVLLVGVLLTGIQTAIYGSFEATTLYKLFDRESEETQKVMVTETAVAETLTVETEPETNHKRQVIVTVPETEAAIATEGVVSR